MHVVACRVRGSARYSFSGLARVRQAKSASGFALQREVTAIIVATGAERVVLASPGSMLPLLAPLLAQLVSLNVGDRTEGRYVASAPRHFEAETRPLAGLNLQFRRATVTLFYAPTVLATRLEDGPHEWLTYHSGAFLGSYRWRHTTLTLGEYIGFGERDPAVDALGLRTAAATPQTPNSSTTPVAITPTTSTGTGGTTAGSSGTPPLASGGTSTGAGMAPATGTGMAPVAGSTGTPAGQLPANGQARVLQQVVHLESITTAVSLTHYYNSALTLRADAGYTVSGGTDAASQYYYPLVRGPSLGVSATDRKTGKDTFVTSGSAQYVSGALPSRTLLLLGNQRWEHAFDHRTLTRLGAGLSINRNSQDNGTVSYGIYPTLELGIAHKLRVLRGTLSLTAGSFAAPVLDPIRVVVDPRVGITTNAIWSRYSFSVGTIGNTSFSLAGGSSAGALNAFNGSAFTAYRLTRALAVDCGVRGAWQSYEGQSVLPFAWLAYAGVIFAANVPLNGEGRR